MADPAIESGNSAKQTAKDLFAGAAGGIAQVLIGMLYFHSFSYMVVFIEALVHSVNLVTSYGI